MECLDEKLARAPYHSANRKFNRQHIMILADIMGPIKTVIIHGHVYILTLIDADSIMATAIPIRSRTEVPDLITQALAKIRRYHPNEALSLHTNNATEMKSMKLKECGKIGVKIMECPSYEHQTSSIAEKWNPTLSDATRCAKVQAKSLESMWHWVVIDAVNKYNLLPHSVASTPPIKYRGKHAITSKIHSHSDVKASTPTPHCSKANGNVELRKTFFTSR